MAQNKTKTKPLGPIQVESSDELQDKYVIVDRLLAPLTSAIFRKCNALGIDFETISAADLKTEIENTVNAAEKALDKICKS